MEHEIRAPLAGKIVKSNIGPGDEIEEDEEILVIEAMKMETPVYSPCNGTVKKVTVKTGDEVEEDDILALVDE